MNQIKEYSEKEMTSFKASFKLVKAADQDKRFGKISIYKNASEHFVFTLSKTFQNKKELEVYLKELKSRDDWTWHENRASVIAFNKLIQEGMCGSQYGVTLITDYFEVTLQKEIEKRALENNRYEEEELWYALCTLVDLLAAWEKNKIYHGDINGNNLCLNTQGQLKVYDNSIVAQHNNALTKTHNSNEACYLSPEQLEAIRTKNLKKSYDVFKSDVFSLAMTIMCMANLKNSSQYYQWTNNEFNYKACEADLAALTQYYSEQFVQTLRSMLQIQTESRPNFTELKQHLNQPRTIIQPQQQVLQQPVLRQSVSHSQPIIEQHPPMRTSIVQPQIIQQPPQIIQQPPVIIQQPPQIIQQPQLVQEQPPIMRSSIVQHPTVIQQQPTIVQQPIIQSNVVQQPIVVQQQPIVRPSIIQQQPVIVNQGNVIRQSGNVVYNPNNVSRTSYNPNVIQNRPQVVQGSYPPQSNVVSGGAISHEQMQQMIQSGLVKRGPNGQLTK